MGIKVDVPGEKALTAFKSDEGLVRIYAGSGRLLLAPLPYWRHRLFASLAAVSEKRTAKA